MRESILAKPRRKLSDEHEAMAGRLLADMSRLEAKMDRDRVFSNQLRSETQVLKAETEIIKARTAATLSELIPKIDSLTRS